MHVGILLYTCDNRYRRPSEEPDRTFDRRRAEVHVPLRRLQILVSGQFLNRPRRGSRIARCEQNVCRRICTPAAHPPYVLLVATWSCTIFIVKGSPLVRTQHPLSTQMTVSRGVPPPDVPSSARIATAPLRRRDLSLPV